MKLIAADKVEKFTWDIPLRVADVIRSQELLETAVEIDEKTIVGILEKYIKFKFNTITITGKQEAAREIIKLLKGEK